MWLHSICSNMSATYYVLLLTKYKHIVCCLPGGRFYNLYMYTKRGRAAEWHKLIIWIKPLEILFTFCTYTLYYTIRMLVADVHMHKANIIIWICEEILRHERVAHFWVVLYGLILICPVTFSYYDNWINIQNWKWIPWICIFFGFIIWHLKL